MRPDHKLVTIDHDDAHPTPKRISALEPDPSRSGFSKRSLSPRPPPQPSHGVSLGLPAEPTRSWPDGPRWVGTSCFVVAGRSFSPTQTPSPKWPSCILRCHHAETAGFTPSSFATVSTDLRTDGFCLPAPPFPPRLADNPPARTLQEQIDDALSLGVDRRLHQLGKPPILTHKLTYRYGHPPAFICPAVAANTGFARAESTGRQCSSHLNERIPLPSEIDSWRRRWMWR